MKIQSIVALSLYMTSVSVADSQQILGSKAVELQRWVQGQDDDDLVYDDDDLVYDDDDLVYDDDVSLKQALF